MKVQRSPSELRLKMLKQLYNSDDSQLQKSSLKKSDDDASF